MNYFTEALLTIFLLVAILFAAWYVTKFTAGKMQRFARGRYIEVIDQVFLGRDRGILLIKVGSKVYLVGFTSAGMECIADITEDQLVPVQYEKTPMDFKNLIKSYMKDYKLFKKGYNPFRDEDIKNEKDVDR